jgi:hypothetical protein
VSGLQSPAPERKGGPVVCGSSADPREPDEAPPRRGTRRSVGFTPPGEPGRHRRIRRPDPLAQTLPSAAVRSSPHEPPASRLCSSFEVRRVGRGLRPTTRSPSMGLFPLRGPVFIAGGISPGPGLRPAPPRARWLAGRPETDPSPTRWALVAEGGASSRGRLGFVQTLAEAQRPVPCIDQGGQAALDRGFARLGAACLRPPCGGLGNLAKSLSDGTGVAPFLRGLALLSLLPGRIGAPCGVGVHRPPWGF